MERSAQGNFQKAALDKVVASRNENITLDEVIALMQASSYLAVETFLDHLHPAAINPAFAANVAGNKMWFTYSTKIKCFRIAYDLDESVPDEWVKKAFF